MKKLDAYIIKKFLGTFVFSVVLFAAIAVVIDLTERVDEFIENKAPIGEIIFDYYLNFIPHIIFLLSPLFIFISAIFFTSQLAYRSEIVAMLASGISFYRILLVPYFFSAVVLVGVQLYGNHFLVPNSNKDRLAFEYTYIYTKKFNRHKDIHMQTEPNTFIYMESYNQRDSIGRRFTLEKIKDQQLTQKLSARKIQWKGETGKWQLSNYSIRTLNGLKESVVTGEKMDTLLNFLPKDFARKVKYKEAMTTPELTAFIEKETLRGTPELEFYWVEKYRRTAIPFATFILTMIALAVASRKSRGGMGFHIAVGIALSAGFILFLQFSTTFATKGNLSPFWSVWIPNILFGILSIYLLRIAPK